MPEQLFTHRCPLCATTADYSDRPLADSPACPTCEHGMVDYSVRLAEG